VAGTAGSGSLGSVWNVRWACVVGCRLGLFLGVRALRVRVGGGLGRVARCWALRNQAPSIWSGLLVGPSSPVRRWWGGAVFLWLFGCWIVDASIFVAVCSDRWALALFQAFVSGGCGGFVICFVVFVLLCLCVWRQAMKGVWWMPWHQEPMKDVGACDKPWGVGNRAVIRGCPNGETWLESCPVTCT
jgi:hypothetical protein